MATRPLIRPAVLARTRRRQGPRSRCAFLPDVAGGADRGVSAIPAPLPRRLRRIRRRRSQSGLRSAIRARAHRRSGGRFNATGRHATAAMFRRTGPVNLPACTTDAAVARITIQSQIYKVNRRLRQRFTAISGHEENLKFLPGHGQAEVRLWADYRCSTALRARARHDLLLSVVSIVLSYLEVYRHRVAEVWKVT